MTGKGLVRPGGRAGQVGPVRGKAAAMAAGMYPSPNLSHKVPIHTVPKGTGSCGIKSERRPFKRERFRKQMPFASESRHKKVRGDPDDLL